MGRTCGSVQNFFRTIDHYPAHRTNLAALESLTNTAKLRGANLKSPFPRKIPVVVHVIHTGGADNISDKQIASQMEVLNEDFNNRNADIQDVPLPFKPAIGNPGLEFYLADRDPGGARTSGITRTQTSVKEFAMNDRMKSDATCGKSPWDTRRYLNIWVCRLEDQLGYGTFPGGDPRLDGVVIETTAFGRGKGFRLQPEFNLGRTATHEVAHYLNLFHTWGHAMIATCRDSDAADDTPNQFGPNRGTPKFPSHSCGNGPNGDMFMNYMDYVDDVAMFMFTRDQVARMHATLEFSRSGLGKPAGAVATGLDAALVVGC